MNLLYPCKWSLTVSEQANLKDILSEAPEGWILAIVYIIIMLLSVIIIVQNLKLIHNTVVSKNLKRFHNW